MIAVDGFDVGYVSSTEFSVWQSPISGLLASVADVKCRFLSSGRTVRARFLGVGRGSTYDLGWRSWVSMTLTGDEEVISTWQVWSSG
jgi:hypothetical protein